MTTRRRRQDTPVSEEPKEKHQSIEQQDLVTKGLLIRSKDTLEDVKGMTRGEVEVPKRTIINITQQNFKS